VDYEQEDGTGGGDGTQSAETTSSSATTLTTLEHHPQDLPPRIRRGRTPFE